MRKITSLLLSLSLIYSCSNNDISGSTVETQSISSIDLDSLVMTLNSNSFAKPIAQNNNDSSIVMVYLEY